MSGEKEPFSFNEIQFDYWVGCFNYKNVTHSDERGFVLRAKPI